MNEFDDDLNCDECKMDAGVGLGAKKDPKDKRDYRVAGIAAPVDAAIKEFILDELYPSKQQYSRGSCTSQAQAHHKERQEKRPLSARFIMGMTKSLEGNTNYGAYTRDTFTVVNKNGVCAEEKYPEPGPELPWVDYVNPNSIPDECFKDAEGHKSNSYWRVENDVESIKSAIWNFKNSVVLTVEWFKEFNRPTNGILPFEFSNSVGGHAVECVGWNDVKQLLKCKNSWGDYWGDNGFFYIPYSILPKIIWDVWSSLDIPAETAVDTYYGLKRDWTTFSMEKAMAFNPWLYKKINRLPNNREIKGLIYGKWDFETVFRGKNGSLWLDMTKPEAIKKGIIIN